MVVERTAATPTLEATPLGRRRRSRGKRPAPTKTPAATKTPEPTKEPVVSGNVVPISSITQDSVGQTVTVRGKVVETASFSAGFKFVLDDGTGRVNLTLFSGNYKFVPQRAGLNYGADVQVTAEVAEFKGVQELQPKAAAMCRFSRQDRRRAFPSPRLINSPNPACSSPSRARSPNVKGFSAGTNLFVFDETGNVRVTLFSNVKVFPRRSTDAGYGIRVVGKTDFFGGVQVVRSGL